IDGLGEVDVASALVTDIMSPWEGTYWQDVPIDLEGIGVAGGSFLFWEVQSGTLVIPDPTDPNQEIIIQDDVVLIAHFGVPQPVDVMFDVQPPGAGDLLFDNNAMAPYPNTQTVNPGNHDLEATPSSVWFVFDHWETINGTVNPDVTTDVGTVFIGQTDTITAVFTEIPNFELTVDVEPAGAGTVVMDGGAITLPWSNTIEGDITYNFVTTPAGQWFEFSHWEINNHVLAPDEFSTDVDLTLTANDQLVAVYDVIEHATYTVIIDPPLSGNVTLDNGVVVSDDYTQDVALGTQIDMVAKPNQYFLFDEYTSELLNPAPNNTTPEVQYTILASDTIVVHFEREPYSMYIPNSFTPNNDGKNDVFKPVGRAVDLNSYELLIFNRWGEVVFRSDNPNEGWNGSHENGEYYVDNQVFFYRMKLRSVHEPDERVVEGHITVLR
ncbi:MAG: gliding motility-associated C-terminal domain-containing protein, partial [Flavobacteriales bacterium]